MTAVLRLLAKAAIRPAGIVVAMTQTERWRAALADIDPSFPARVRGALSTPLLARGDGGWRPAGG